MTDRVSNNVKPPLLSVVVSAYNVADYISGCIESLLVSDSASYEIVAVDDGSSDTTLDHLTELAERDSRVRAISRTNGGPGAARNSGIDNARGRYLTFVDGDDWVDPQYIDTILAEIEFAPATELWVFDYLAVAETDRSRRRCGAGFWRAQNAPWNKVYRRELIGADRFDEDILYEDLATVRPWVARARITRHIDLPLYCYRNMRVGSIMNSVDTRRFYQLLTAAERCTWRIERDLGEQGARDVLGTDWQRRFYTVDVFMPGIVDWPRKIDNAIDRRRFSTDFLARLTPEKHPSKSLLARHFGLKIAVGALCYECGAASTGDFLLHGMGRIKRQVTDRLAPRSRHR